MNASGRRPARPRRLYYGWIIVAGYFLSGVAGSGPTLWAFSVFVVPMQDDLGWTRGTFYFAITIRTLLMGVMTVFFSRLMDRKGWPAPVMVTSSIISAVAIMLLGTVHTVWQYLLVSALLLGVGSAGSMGMLHMAIVPKWFVRRRGQALALGSMGTAVAAFVFPQFANVAIDAFGWRGAWLAMGISSFLLLVPIAFFQRRAPEDMGLLPDGDTAAEVAARHAAQAGRGIRAQDEYSFQVKEIIWHPTTWFIVAATTLAAPTMVGLTANWVPHYRDIGISQAVSATALTLYGAGSIVSRFAWGFFLDRFHVRWVSIAQALLTVLTILFLLFFVRSGTTAMVYGALQGLVLGGYLPIQPLVWANFFGRRHLGAIRGTFSPFTTLSSALGPFAIAAVHDVRGDYALAFWVLLAFWLLVAAFMALARPIPRPAPVARAAEAG